MPARKKKSKSKSKSKTKSNRKTSRKQPAKTRTVIIHRPIYYYPFNVPQPVIRKPKQRPHHYEYSSDSVHEHLNRVNHRPDHELSVQDQMQRQLKQNVENYKPNYMHVSSEELAIPAPRRINGMRVFTNV